MKNSDVELLNQKPIKSTELYSLHKIKYKGKNALGKFIYTKYFEENDLMDTLDYNGDMLSDLSNYAFPDSFLQIKGTQAHSGGIIFITEEYDISLDEYLSQNILTEGQALDIMDQVMKATYSLSIEGYWSRNFRTEHFVRVGKKWKLHSLVYSQQFIQKEFTSEYLFSKMHQTPESYRMLQFTDQELDQWIVWDLGCILIHLLTGNHKLKSQAILNTFKGEPFSFSSIGFKKSDKFSPQIKELLGKMCHHNHQKRMKSKQMMQESFLSAEVAAHLKKNLNNKKSQIYSGGFGSASKTLSLSKSKKLETVDMSKEEKNRNDKEKKVENAMLGNNNNKIQNQKQFKNKMDVIRQDVEGEFSYMEKDSQVKFDNINNEKFYSILSLYKNFMDKCKLISQSSDSFHKILKINSQKNSYIPDLLALTDYALLFVKAMNLCKISQAMNNNQPFFEDEEALQGQFLGSVEHKSLKRWVNFMRKTSMKDIETAKDLIDVGTNTILKQNKNVKHFVTQCFPLDCNFDQIKAPYRFILKNSYDLIVDKYSQNKTNEWASIGMYITYSMAIDKLYIQNQFKDNFKHYFQWAENPPSNHVQLQQFQEYLQNADKKILVENSCFILKKFYAV